MCAACLHALYRYACLVADMHVVQADTSEIRVLAKKAFNLVQCRASIAERIYSDGMSRSQSNSKQMVVNQDQHAAVLQEEVAALRGDVAHLFLALKAAESRHQQELAGVVVDAAQHQTKVCHILHVDFVNCMAGMALILALGQLGLYLHQQSALC